jgi:hypothetical protein
MRDYSDGQFKDRAIVASKQQRGKYCIAKVQRYGDEVFPLHRSHHMTLAQAKALLSQGYTTHDISYLTNNSATITYIWCIDKEECLSKLANAHPGQPVKLLSFDGIAA